ncbi:MAG: cytochrome c biogenesis protein CcdA, partial [Candidatus Micrarchaeota archaeon]
MASGQEITLITAFTAGLASVLSPCFLPLLPAFVSYLGGLGVVDSSKASREKVMLNTGFFVLGFILVFSVLGILLNSTLSAFSAQAIDYIEVIAGITIVVFGLWALGLVRISFLEKERKLKPMKTRY